MTAKSKMKEYKLEDEEFDIEFLEQLDLLEFQLTSSSSQPPPPPLPPPLPPLISHPSVASSSFSPPIPPPSSRRNVAPNVHHNNSLITTLNPNLINNNNNYYISYSPPRELSQRFNTTTTNNNSGSNISDSSCSTRSSHSPTSPQQLQIDRLKTELSRVSKQLADLTDECTELRKERYKTEQLKSIHSDAKTNKWNGISLRENINPTAGRATSLIEIEQRSIGIQTDKGDEHVGASVSCTTSANSDFPKLSSIWSRRSSHDSNRKFVAKLLESCADDFCALFSSLDPNVTSKMVNECLTHVPMAGNSLGLHTTEATRTYQLYSVFAQLSNDIVHVNAFLKILLGICRLENALAAPRCLHILRVVVDYLLSTKRKRYSRDNIQVKRSQFGLDAVCIHDSELGKSGTVCKSGGDETCSKSLVTTCNNIGTAEHESTTYLCHIDWFHLFTSMCQVAIGLTDVYSMVEAVSIMNIIVRGMDPFSERGRFVETSVFEAVAHLLKKEAGLFCQREAVHLFYLLLNCPKILASFCSCCRGTEVDMQSSSLGAESSAYQASRAILEGFAACLVHSGRGVKELNLCRNAIIVLAFLASSGKFGLEILLFHKLPNTANFLELILQVLVSETDAEASESSLAPEVSKERTLLLREALILLNRLSSHPIYSATVLQVLTSCGGMVNLVIDIATRLTKKSWRLLDSDSVTRQMRDFEVVDLARLFKKRIFTFLGASS